MLLGSLGEASAYERGSALPLVDSSDIDGAACPQGTSTGQTLLPFLSHGPLPWTEKVNVALSDKLRRYFRMNVSI